MKAILLEGRDKARAVLRGHRADLDNLAVLLLDKESIGKKELDGYFGEPDAAADEGPSKTDELLHPDMQQLRT